VDIAGRAGVRQPSNRVDRERQAEQHDLCGRAELGALSAFAHFGTVNPKDLDAMHKLFAFPESHIYDTKNSLWWRDSRWVGTTTHLVRAATAGSCCR